MGNFKKTVKKGKKALKKVMNSETAKELVRREKLLTAEMLIRAAEKFKEDTKKNK